jgi:putative hemolysin
MRKGLDNMAMDQASPAPSRAKRHDHIVDALIAERAPGLTGSWMWPLLRPPIYALLEYGKARRMADAIAPLGGRETMDYVSGLLELKVEARFLERIPATGRWLAVCNHPTGIADGLAVYRALKRVREDFVFYANADALRVSPRLDEVILPVEWQEGKRTPARTRKTLAQTKAIFEAEGAIVVFPAGRLSRREPSGLLTDPAWMSGALSMARRYGAPVLPMHLEGPWSTLFHLFHRFSPELRDMTLFHELLNKKGGQFRLTVGQLIAPEALVGDDAAATLALKHHVERVLPADPEAPFSPAPPAP